MIGNLFLFSLIEGILSGVLITLYSLGAKYLSCLLFFEDPFKTIPNLPVWYVYLVPISIVYGPEKNSIICCNTLMFTSYDSHILLINM